MARWIDPEVAADLLASAVRAAMLLVAALNGLPVALMRRTIFRLQATIRKNTLCENADASVLRVRIIARDIDSPIMGLCSSPPP